MILWFAQYQIHDSTVKSSCHPAFFIGLFSVHLQDICNLRVTEVNQSSELCPDIFPSFIFKYRDFLESGLSPDKVDFLKSATVQR